MVAHPLVVWRISDGKPGHANQTLGLVAALARLLPVKVYHLEAPSPWRLWSGDPFAEVAGRGAPELLLGAGHATHLPLLRARQRHGGRAVVLMRPSLPARWFDLSLVPEHDGVANSPRVLQTRGVINAVRARPGPRDGTGLLLVGGPSRHHDWDADDLCAQLLRVVDQDCRRGWTLATSRRTPTGFAARVRALGIANLEVVTPEQAPAGWLAERLAAAEVAWVGEDSVSMIYEALTGGAAVGLLALPPHGGTNRLLRGLDRLLADGWVASFEQWCRDGRMLPPRRGFNEAERCARVLKERWWPSH